MKSTPLLFSAKMARANIEDRKSQTRRIVKNMPVLRNGSLRDNDYLEFLKRCPYGQPGDEIWQKETFHKEPTEILYRADGAEIGCHHWTPSIFMPRESSRFTATITEVRIQRLQEITNEDAESEGVKPIAEATPAPSWMSTAPDCVGIVKHLDFITPYRSLWNSINLKPSPVYGPKDKTTRKRPILHYVSYPWSIEDFRIFLSSIKNHQSSIDNPQSPTWRNKPLHIIPNPWVWAISYKRNP